MFKSSILIIGFGESGKWAYNLALKLGYMPLIFDDKFVKIENCWLDYSCLDFAVVSPGVPPEHDILKKLREHGVAIISEIEFCYLVREEKSPIIGVTGTNGKTTVTEMIASVMGSRAIVAGNIGMPWSEAVVKKENANFTLLELSSFQLDNINLFHPHIAVLTNFAPDHIDYHGCYEKYIDAKMNLVKNMDGRDFLIYNADDVEVGSRVGCCANCRTLYFSEKQMNGEGIYLSSNGEVVVSLAGCERVVFRLNVNKHYEKHMILNILASALVCVVAGIEDDFIARGILNFKPSAFRQEVVENNLGLKIVNDSKATNLGAVIMALGEHKPEVLLMGGRGKRENYEKLFVNPSFRDLIVYGEMGDEIVATASDNNFYAVHRFKRFEDAVNFSIKLTKKGETLLFSPAGSSFDQFSSYKERGEKFNQIVNSFR